MVNGLTRMMTMNREELAPLALRAEATRLAARDGPPGAGSWKTPVNTLPGPVASRIKSGTKSPRSADSPVCCIADCQSASVWSGNWAWLRRTGAEEGVIRRRLATCETAGWAACATQQLGYARAGGFSLPYFRWLTCEAVPDGGMGSAANMTKRSFEFRRTIDDLLEYA